MRAAPRGVGRSVGRGACGPAIELRNIRRPGCRRSPCSGRPYGEVRQREYPAGSASSETLARTPRSLHGNREISRLAARYRAARIGKAGRPKPMMHGREKSDPAIVAGKSANKGGRRRRSRWSQELAPGLNRGAGAEGNTVERGTRRTPGRGSVSPGLDRVRQAAKERKKETFTALLHHVDVDLLRYAYKRCNGRRRLEWTG